MEREVVCKVAHWVDKAQKGFDSAVCNSRNESVSCL